MRAPLLFALKAAVSVGLVWLLLDQIGVADVAGRVASVEPAMVVACLATLTAQALLWSLRWRLVSASIGAPLPAGPATAWIFIGLFFAQTLPTVYGGDVVRAYKVRRHGHALGTAITGVMLDRVAGFVSLIVLITLSTPFLFARLGDDPARWLLPALLVPAAAALAVMMSLDRAPTRLRRWRAVQALAQLAADTRRLFLDPAGAVAVVGLAMAGHLTLGLGLYALARGLDLGAGVVDCLVLFPPVMLLMSVPVSIGGWGLREGGLVAALGLVGVAADGALSASVLFGALQLAVGLPGGLVWLLGGRTKPVEAD